MSLDALHTVLIANRGEIAVRIARTLRRLGLRAVAVHSDADAGAPHVRAADVAVRIGPTPPVDSYLRVEAIVGAARRTGATAVHPGYGFLAESPALADACAAAGITFVGPPADVIAAMGDKARARTLVRDAGVPVVAGTDPGDDAALRRAAGQLGFPVMVKPVAGGGGTGMQVVERAEALADALAVARRRARAAFGDDRVFLERAVDGPRHVEVQVLADDHGGVVTLGERECSLQRRHQKLVEESPSPLLDEPLRERLTATAAEAARACGYRGAGTVEFIVPTAEPSAFAFIEMNTRLQVEHPVTELVTGVDLVEWQLRIAAGERLALDAVTTTGHAIEARITAEDPGAGFLPGGGRVLRWRPPEGRGIRVDAGVAEGMVVPTAYDSLLAKVVAVGRDRAEALRRLRAALADTVILGLPTTTGLLHRLLAHPAVVAGSADTTFVEAHLDGLTAAPPSGHVLVAAIAALTSTGRAPDGAGSVFDRHDGWRAGGATPIAYELVDDAGRRHGLTWRGGARGVVTFDAGPAMPVAVDLDDGDATVALDGVTRRLAVAVTGGAVWVADDGEAYRLRRPDVRVGGGDTARTDGTVTAPMPGTVIAVTAAVGDVVDAGQVLVAVEAMKMEHRVAAPVAGVVVDVAVDPGDRVELRQPLVTVAPVSSSDGTPGPTAGRRPPAGRRSR